MKVSAIVASGLLAIQAFGAQAQTLSALIDPDARARSTEAKLTGAERTGLTHSTIALPIHGQKVPAGAPLGAGYVPGVARLGVPALTETDASLGVAYVVGLRKDGATALPSGMAMGSTWNPALVREGGARIALEAQAKGFNVLLAGGVNLVRDPRGGRNFEYLSEDPLLTGLLGGAAVAGVQSQHVIATVKHFALNATETGRHFYDAEIGDAALRMSDLLAFHIAIEQGRPGAVMCAYNHVNGSPACGSDYLLNRVLKHEWGYAGFVMSDWGATNGVEDALAGLDQQSGQQLDDQVWFGFNLLAAAQRDPKYRARLADMDRRILRSVYAVGVDANPPQVRSIDVEAGAAVAQKLAEQGIVLLRNRHGALPLAASAKRIVVIGGHADAGVLSGGGSSQVEAQGGPTVSVPTAGSGFLATYFAQNYQGSSPLKAIKAHAPEAEISYRDGRYITDAVIAAKEADIAIIFATQWGSEGFDLPDLSLPDGQDQLIAAVAAANPHTIVVLETGGPVVMPWLEKTAAVVEAWYSGARGGEAIARVLFGDVDPSGRLPVSFPASVDQLPRPLLPGAATVEPDSTGRGKPGDHLTIDYNIEGADVGYRWFAREHQTPLFPFGFGLSYTSFERSGLALTGGTNPSATFTVRNIGERTGAEVAQVYLVNNPSGRALRLVGFTRLELKPGEARTVRVAIDPRMLAQWTPDGWRISQGTFRFALGGSSMSSDVESSVNLDERRFTDADILR